MTWGEKTTVFGSSNSLHLNHADFDQYWVNNSIKRKIGRYDGDVCHLINV